MLLLLLLLLLKHYTRTCDYPLTTAASYMCSFNCLLMRHSYPNSNPELHCLAHA
jgi:hypothetical protein